MNTVFIIVFGFLYYFHFFTIILIKKWNIKIAALFVGRILLSIVYFINGMMLGLQRNWVEPPYETEWDFFVKSLLNGKTDALMHLLLLIIIITLDLVVTFYYINKKEIGYLLLFLF
ncbi:hypothetical protein ACT7DL_30600 [Bacillus paranthracis]